MSLALANESLARRERQADRRIPYTRPLDEFVTRTRQGHYVQVLKISGAAFESADASAVMDWEDRLNRLWVSHASPQFALWSTLVHRRNNSYPGGHFRPGFAADFNAKYRSNVIRRELWTNDIYLSLISMPEIERIEEASRFSLRKIGHGDAARRQREARENCQRLRDEIMQSLAMYGPEPMGTVIVDGTERFEMRGLFGFLLNGVWEHAGVPTFSMDRALTTAQVIIGDEVIEYRTADQTRYGAMLGIDDYPSKPKADFLSALLSEADFPFVKTQSFSFVDRAKAVDSMKTEARIMVESGDFSPDDAELMVKAGVADLNNREIAGGDHHFWLQVQTDFYDGVRMPDEVERERLRTLNSNISQARRLLRDAGIMTARASKALLEAAYFGQLPGNFQYRPFLVRINTLDLASFVSLHNLPAGKKKGRWGPALIPLVTNAQTLYYYSPHVRDVGHKIVFGPTGTGKSAFAGAEITMLQKVDCTVVVLDIKETQHILIRRLGGVYQALKMNVPSGWNPLQMKPTSHNVGFLRQWLGRLVHRAGLPLRPDQDENLDNSLRAVLSDNIPREFRRLSRVLDFINSTGDDALADRLAPWCEGGENAWLFDNPRDQLIDLMSGGARLAGFDLTDIIDHAVFIDPAAMYLWHVIESLADGRKLSVYADEANKVFAHEYTAKRVARALEMWRSLEAMLTLLMQQTNHALASPIARQLIEQTPTKIFFANANASEEEFCSEDAFGRSHREFNIVKRILDPEAHQFLICQGQDSIVAGLPLGDGFEYELAVIAGQARAIAKMKALIAEHGEAVHQWEPHFKQWVASPQFKELQ